VVLGLDHTDVVDAVQAETLKRLVYERERRHGEHHRLLLLPRHPHHSRSNNGLAHAGRRLEDRALMPGPEAIAQALDGLGLVVAKLPPRPAHSQ
jgi:hypothetical protein